jgi:hypothetical protein
LVYLRGRLKKHKVDEAAEFERAITMLCEEEEEEA